MARGLQIHSYKQSSPREHPGFGQWPQAQQQLSAGTGRGGQPFLIRQENQGACNCQGGSDKELLRGGRENQS